jgi:methyl-accepting chemotaxis protein
MRSKLIASFSVLLLVVIVTGALTVMSSRKIERQAGLMSETSLMRLEIAEKLRLPLIELEQIFTGASAGRSAMEQGSADKPAGVFKKHLGEMKQKCNKCHGKLSGGRSPELKEADKFIKELGPEFDAYYSLGMKLAAPRSAGSTEAFNLSVEELRPLAAEINLKLNMLARMGENHSARALQEMARHSRGVRRVALLGTFAAAAFGAAVAFLIIQRMKHVFNNVIATAGRIAAGDLGGRDLAVDKRDEVGYLTESLNAMKRSLNDMIGKIGSTANQIASSSEELSATVENITERLKEQTVRADQAASATTQMSQTVLDIAGNASNMATSSEDTLKVAGDGAEIVGKTVSEVQEISNTVTASAQVMKSLGERSTQIGEIISVINEIADQTNLLALNAAIEAARAGEQGRGFAVVADEVRKLAERTARATTEISQMISAIQEETEQAVTSMDESLRRVVVGAGLSNQAGESLKTILESVNTLQSMVHHIASATEEMSTTSDMISSDIEAMASVSKQTSINISEITRASTELAALSSELKEISQRFKTGKG